MHKYAITIHWSAEDGVFIAEAPDLPGCMAHGDTHEAALAEIQVAISLWLDTAAEFNDPLPEPARNPFPLPTEIPYPGSL